MTHIPYIAIFPQTKSEEGVDLTLTILLSDEGKISLDINGTIWLGDLQEILKSGWGTVELDDSVGPETGLQVCHPSCIPPTKRDLASFKQGAREAWDLTGDLEKATEDTTKTLQDWQNSASSSEEEQKIKRGIKVAQSILNAYEAGRCYVAVPRPALVLRKKRTPLRR